MYNLGSDKIEIWNFQIFSLMQYGLDVRENRSIYE